VGQHGGEVMPTAKVVPRNGWFFIRSIMRGWYRVTFIAVKWEPRDVWIGVYWTPYPDGWLPFLTNFRVYVCIVPMVPIIFDLIEREP
jgi:hypothetical protein